MNGLPPRTPWRRSEITDHAQEQLGEIVYIELPSVGDKISKDDPFGVVESVKAVSDIYAPVSGTVIKSTKICPKARGRERGSLRRRMAGQGADERPTDLDDLMDNNEYEEMIAREKE